MEVTRAAEFLANSILVGAGFCIVFITIVVINNLLHKYWKPVRIFTKDSWHINPPRFMTEEEYQKMREKDPQMGEIAPPKDKT